MFKSVFKSGIRASYDVSNNPTFVSEPWYIYPAKHNASGKLASVFIFDKTKFESTIHKLCSNMSNTKNPKVIISECYELIKYEVSEMTKLKHPQLLTIFEVLEETRSKFLFATEPVVDNLLTIDFEAKLDDLSIQKGLLEICKGVQFLHNYCSIIHLNLQPSSIFINQQGDWKVAGFKFLQNLNEISPQERENYFIMNNTSIVPFSNMNLNFTPPELIVDNQSKLDFGNDIWSLGCLIYYVYNKGDHLINCFDANSISDFKGEFRKFETKFYNHRLTDLKYVLKDIPDQLYRIFPSILARYPHDRLTIDQIIDSDYFNGSLIKAMWFIDEFSTKSLEDKLIFLKGLLEVKEGSLFLDQFPTTFKTAKLLPLLIDLLKSELSISLTKQDKEDTDKIDMVSYALAISLKIGSTLSSLTFKDRIFEQLFMPDSKMKKKERIDFFEKLINYSVKVRLTLIENFDVLLDKLNEKDFTDIIKKSTSLILTLPSDEQQFKSDQIRAQDLFLSKIPTFVQMFDFPYIKNTFFPSITQVFKTTSVLSTKLATISVMDNIVGNNVVDKIIVTEQVLPLFQNLKSRDKRIVSSVLQFFDKLCRNDHILLDLETIVESILPICLKLVFGCNDCTQAEFTGYMKTVTDIQGFLMKKKLVELPVKVPVKTGTTGTNNSNFDSLINTQAINSSNLDNIHTGPQTESIVPTRKTAGHVTGHTRDSTSRTNAVLQPTKANSFTSKPSHILQPKADILQPKAKPLNLKHQSDPSGPLRFGNTGTSTNGNYNLRSTATQSQSTNKLLNTLEGTFAANEFSDFQSATPSSTTPVLTPAMTPKTVTPRTSTPVTNSMAGSGSKPPPGFYNNILTPSSASKSVYSARQPANGQNGTSGANPDILDLI